MQCNSLFLLVCCVFTVDKKGLWEYMEFLIFREETYSTMITVHLWSDWEWRASPQSMWNVLLVETSSSNSYYNELLISDYLAQRQLLGRKNCLVVKAFAISMRTRVHLHIIHEVHSGNGSVYHTTALKKKRGARDP